MIVNLNFRVPFDAREGNTENSKSVFIGLVFWINFSSHGNVVNKEVSVSLLVKQTIVFLADFRKNVQQELLLWIKYKNKNVNYKG